MPGKRILLVDNATPEREELASHLVRAGYLVTQAEDGALAINKAVMDPPELVITASELAPMDGFKLCQLLRSNPATRHLPFLFITVKETNPRKLADFIRPADDFIIKPFKTEEMLGRVHNLFYRLDKVQEVSSEVDRSVAGTLTEIALVDLLQIFKLNRKNGLLTLKSEGRTGILFIREGEVVNAQVGKVSGEKAVYRLLGWAQGTFEFKPAQTAAETKIHQPTENLVMEGMRRLDETIRIRATLPSRESYLAVIKRFTGPESKLRPVTREVLRLLEFFNRIEDILDNSTFPDLEVYETLQALLERGIVEIRETDESAESRARGPLLTLEESLKVGYYLGVGQEESNRQWMGKILIFSTRPEHLQLFMERVAMLPEFHREECDAAAPRPANLAIGVKGGLSILDKTSILLLTLPHDAGFEPLWKVFRHRAIGALVLGGERDAAAQHALAFLRTEKIPFAAIAVSGGGDAGEEQPVEWQRLDPADLDFPRKAMRALFDAILS